MRAAIGFRWSVLFVSVTRMRNVPPAGTISVRLSVTTSTAGLGDVTPNTAATQTRQSVPAVIDDVIDVSPTLMYCATAYGSVSQNSVLTGGSLPSNLFVPTTLPFT